MKKSRVTILLKHCSLPVIVITLTFACKPNQGKLSTTENATVKDSVTLMAENIERDISTKGPAAWLDYFEDGPDFFMASDGQIAFTDYPSSRKFILNTLVKAIPHINLKWKNLRVYPLANNLAVVGADFHEELTGSNGKTQNVNGYFTGTAIFKGPHWKLKNLHWSISH
jgi:hypothetical protein